MKSKRYAGDRRPKHKATEPRFSSSLLVRLARALQLSQVPYLLTGADAVSYYGAPRRSEDKDLVIMTVSADALQRVVNALRAEDFDVQKLEPGHNTIFDGGFRIDIKVKPELEDICRIRIGRGLWPNLTTPEHLILMKLELWDGKSYESNDAQDLMKILVRQRKTLDLRRVRTEALKRRTYSKLEKIERYLSRTVHRSEE